VTDWADALVELLQARGLALRRYAVLLGGSEYEADDLLQEALARVFAGRGHRAGPESLEAYLHKTMANLVIDAGRRRQRWVRVRHRFAAPAHDGGRLAETSADRLDTRASLATPVGPTPSRSRPRAGPPVPVPTGPPSTPTRPTTGSSP
jgi:RNA polymerase sigma-70 factor (ECF subfamily)